MPVADRDVYIDDDDFDALEARPMELAALLGDLTPEEHRDALQERIDIARSALRDRPSSCTNRTRREEAFAELYVVMETHFAMTRDEVDSSYRLLEDAVFAELDYEQSNTCCWNQSTPAMAEIMLNLAELEASDDSCVEVTVFRAEADGADGYSRWADHATALGRADEWVVWSADETCPWSDVPQDVVTSPTDTCEEPVDVDPCGGLDWAGTCEGETVRWCENERVYSYDCPPHLSCGWVDDLDYAWCAIGE